MFLKLKSQIYLHVKNLYIAADFKIKLQKYQPVLLSIIKGKANQLPTAFQNNNNATFLIGALFGKSIYK